MRSDETDYSGMRFNHWTIIRFDSKRYEQNVKYWLCRCDCGKERVQSIFGLKSGKTKSCGHDNQGTHGMTRFGKRAPEYRAWEQLKQRCLNPNHISYPHYGARGIQICEFILNHPTSIKELLGLRPHKAMSVDRKQNDGHYSCGSCEQCVSRGWQMNLRWGTKKEQSDNRSISVFAMIHGVQKIAADIARAAGMRPSSIHRRLKRGLSGEQLLMPWQHKGGRPKLRA